MVTNKGVERVLLAAYKIANDFVRSKGGKHHEYLEARSIVSLSVVTARDRFRPSKGCKFVSYACTYAKKDLLHWWKEKSIHWNKERDLPEEVMPVDGVDRIEAMDRYSDLANAMLNLLNRRDRSLLRHRFGINTDPKSYERIAEIFGLTKQGVNVAIRKAIERLQRATRS
jgi:RNA polymerase sigma factor (sigma-70 family)